MIIVSWVITDIGGAVTCEYRYHESRKDPSENEVDLADAICDTVERMMQKALGDYTEGESSDN